MVCGAGRKAFGSVTKTSDAGLTLVIGGVRAGKSSFALSLLTHARRPVFMATMDCDDEETQVRIDAHRQERPRQWRTVEAQADLAGHLADVDAEVDGVLIDCLTNYVANCLQAGEDEKAVAVQINEFLDVCARATYPIVIVSNEVGFDLTPESELGAVFPAYLGLANQLVAARAAQVYLVVAGVPVALK